MWNYLYFFSYLDLKEATEYDAIEQFVATKLFTTSYDFFPTNKALCLLKHDKEADDDEEVEARIASSLDKLLLRSELVSGELNQLGTRMTVLESAVKESASRGVASGVASSPQRPQRQNIATVPLSDHSDNATPTPTQPQQQPQPERDSDSSAQQQQPQTDAGGNSSA